MSDSRLRFWYRAESSSYPQDLAVKIGTTVILQITGITNTTYLEVTVPLVAYTGQTVEITFTGQTGTGGWDYGICVDDVTVELIPFIWTGTISGEWNNPANWDRGTLPGPYDLVVIPFTTNLPVIDNNSTITVYDVVLEPNASITVETGSTLNVLKNNP
jgi:hypothetical protein